MKNKVIREINKVFDDHRTNLAKNSIEVDKSKLSGLLENLYSPGPSFQYIFDLPSRSFTFVSNGITNLFRENPENFTVESYANRLHPEDFQHFMNCEEIAGYFLFSHIDLLFDNDNNLFNVYETSITKGANGFIDSMELNGNTYRFQLNSDNTVNTLTVE